MYSTPLLLVALFAALSAVVSHPLPRAFHHPHALYATSSPTDDCLDETYAPSPTTDDCSESAQPSTAPASPAVTTPATSPTTTPTTSPTAPQATSPVATTPAASPTTPPPTAPSSSAATPTPSPSAVVNAQSSSNGPFTGGVATYFYQNGNAGACGQVNSDSALICAMDQTRFGTSGPSSPLCGQQVQITNLNNGQTLTVTIADDCPTCNNENSIDLSVGAFQALSNNDLSIGEFPISWVFV